MRENIIKFVLQFPSLLFSNSFNTFKPPVSSHVYDAVGVR